ncbi:MAG: transketolase [Coriobacteriia bacterium]|nr:transketolase [Coriobacteriia bacterium]
MLERGFEVPVLDDESAQELEVRARDLRGAILTMTTLAASGHPGGSMSSLEMYLVLWHFAKVDPLRPRVEDRDRIVVSHGHTSPGVYCALADAGFFRLDDAVAHFRQAGSVFEGHVERSVPGVEWGTGNLGQGLSAGVGFALASRLTGRGSRTFVAMSDGEQHKGQVAEARRLAVKEKLADLTVLVDFNGIQISGHTADVMPVDVATGFAADGWGVIEVDGHDVRALYAAVAQAVADTSRPVAVIARTVIGKGVSFMEGRAEFHGRGLTPEEYERAMAELGCEPTLDAARERRGGVTLTPALHRAPRPWAYDPGTPRTYTREKHADNRSAWGTALADIAEANPGVPMAVLDCDLAVSVKTDGFARVRPDGFIQCGVGEHNAATTAGALSVSGVLTFFSGFGVFGIDEVYNQQRLNDINETQIKLAVTHCGLDVGEDGKTHQCLDYVGAFRNMFGWKVIVPADPNQTDRAVREIPVTTGCVAIAMGRSKLPVILGLDGEPLFGGDYKFEYGRATWAREGADGVIMTMGTVAGAAVEASDLGAEHGLSLGVCIVSSPLQLDDEAMARVADAPWVLVAEDHGSRTGLGASVAEWVAERGIGVRVVAHGVTGYQSSGASSDLLARAGLDAQGIIGKVRELLG